MERLQRYGGTAGYASAFCLLVLLILSFGVPGTGATYADPAGALAKIAGDRWLWRLSNLAGILASGLAVVFTAVVFTIGLWVRLREPAPTRATIVLYFVIIGLGGYALSGFVLWKGGLAMASFLGRDQVAATHAWLALDFMARGAADVGNAFVGAALLIVGWAIADTGALSRRVGWLAGLTGILTLLVIRPFASVVEILQALLTIVWLAWAGSELRKA